MGSSHPMDTSKAGEAMTPQNGGQQHQQQQGAATSSSSRGSPFVSLVQQVFGGKMQTSYTCFSCRSVSRHRDMFTELHLAVPDQSASAVETKSDTGAEVNSENKVTSSEPQKEKEKQVPLTMQSLVTNYLESEVLEGDNKYHCDKCGGLREAEKTVKILEGPSYLICTLLRFKYDRDVNRKSKVFTDVDYRLDLELPVEPEEEKDDGGDGRRESYSLYAVVVHSGYSSDGGHYYTYAREPKERAGTGEREEDLWFVLNDSKVSFATFESFKTVSKRFPRDAAYQLFYRKTSSTRQEGPLPASIARRPLRSELRKAVEDDNLKFLREKERSSTSSASSTSSSLWSQRKDDDGRGGGGGGGGMGGCGGGGFNSPGRLVC